MVRERGVDARFVGGVEIHIEAAGTAQQSMAAVYLAQTGELFTSSAAYFRLQIELGMKKYFALPLFFCALACQAEFLQFDLGRSGKLQIGLDIKAERNLMVSLVRMGPAETYLVKVSNCKTGAGQIFIFDSAGKKLQDTFNWVKDGKEMSDVIGTNICKHAPK
ncbi:MAG: hypothetical protein H7Y28_08610 [Rhodoferax sp.]|nr:hypothetical protein [Rhodoferax sp.]